jgi:hypothetical protein
METARPAAALPQARRSDPKQPTGAVAAVPSVDRLAVLLTEAGEQGLSFRSLLAVYPVRDTPGERELQVRLYQLYDRLKPSGRIRAEFRPLKQVPGEYAIQETRYYAVTFAGAELFD